MTIDQYIDKIVAMLKSSPSDDVLRAVARVVLDRSEACDDPDTMTTIEDAAFGKRVEHGCGSMNLPGDDRCWGCDEQLP